MQRDNLFYIILGLIAVVLIGVTIALQLMLLSGRSTDQTNASSGAAALESNAANTDRANDATGADDRAISMVINTPTSTAIVIAVEPSNVESEPTTIPIEPTSTPVQPITASNGGSAEAAGANQGATEIVAEPTPVPVQPTAQPTTPPTIVPTEPPLPPTEPPQPTPIPTRVPTDTPVTPVDFVFGYVDGRPECTLVTEVVASLFETWGWSTRLVRFSTMDAIFSPALYEGDNPQKPDLAFCYRDPEDRPLFLSQNGADIELVSSGYVTIDDQKYYVLAHSGLPAQLRYENPCVLKFLKELTLDSSTITDVSSPVRWTAQNIDLVQSWGTCEVGAQ